MGAWKSWLEEARPQFLLASLVSVFVGASLAMYEGFPFKLFHFALATTGALVAHIGIHAFNDYSDYMTGIDLRVRRTPFSGGSGVLPSGRLQPTHVYYFGVACLLVVASIGIYFTVTVGLAILPIGLLGIAILYSYTSHLARVGLGELGCVVGFALWSIGPYLVLTGGYSLSILSTSLVSGLMGVALLILNEFPDIEADRVGGRRNIPIMFGLKGASRIYAFVVALAYVWLLVLVTTRILPLSALLAFVTLPIGIRVITLVLKEYESDEKLMKALRLNVIMVLALPFLVSVGTLIASFR
jgi:1,4-dihydroxy-2-naphthoate octaprenyltransferase